MIQRPVANGRAELGIVGAAESGEPGPVVARVPGGEHRLALGDGQRVHRDPGMERQARLCPGDLGGEELADGTEQAGTGRPVVGCRGRADGVGQRVGDRQRRGVAEREQNVILLLAYAAAEHRVLDRRLGVGEVARGLPTAEESPSHGAVQLPPLLGGLVRGDAAAVGVARHQVGAGPEPADRARRAEPPRLGAQPAQVVHRITAMGQLPVQHSPQPVGGHDQVAGPEVAVHEPVPGGRRPVLGEPPQADLQSRPRLGELLVQLDRLAERIDPRQAGDGIGVYRVDAGQDLAEPAREPGPHGRVRVVPQQPPRDRLPVQALHQQVGPALAEGFGPVVMELGHRDAGRSRGGHGRGLERHVPAAILPARLTEQDEAALRAVGGPRFNAPALPARAAGQLLDAADLDGRPPQRLQARRQELGQPDGLGHETAPPSPGPNDPWPGP